jgi:hypothetical protein
VVGHVGKRRVTLFDSKPQRGARVGDEVGAYPESVDLEGVEGNVVEDGIGEVPDPDGKKGRGKVPSQTGVEASGRRHRSPDMDLDFGVEQRPKEREPLDMVHMQVTEEDVNSLRSGQCVAQTTDSTARI